MCCGLFYTQATRDEVFGGFAAKTGSAMRRRRKQAQVHREEQIKRLVRGTSIDLYNQSLTWAISKQECTDGVTLQSPRGVCWGFFELSEPSDGTRLLLLAGKKMFLGTEKGGNGFKAGRSHAGERCRWCLRSRRWRRSAEVAAPRCELGWCENQLTLIKRLGGKKINKLGRNAR